MVFEVVTYATPIVAPALPPLEDGEEPRLDQPGVRIILGGQDRARDEGIGRLIVSTRCGAPYNSQPTACGDDALVHPRSVYWINDADSSRGYRIGFPTLSLHAISRGEAPHRASHGPRLHSHLCVGGRPGHMRRRLPVLPARYRGIR
jgi:hypothetical protein